MRKDLLGERGSVQKEHKQMRESLLGLFFRQAFSFFSFFLLHMCY